jgi:uncharacterized paraquat-inducible protein A
MTELNFDTLQERLRERIAESTDYGLAECLNCNATLTQADIDNDRTCTQCGSNIDANDEDCCHFDD